ncbi:MAG: FtsX-like permease family protein, partial [Cellulomonadaceae bacterium]|nr:FtsX-like permease family protein [Cellulomonadaceae bacterium]
MLRLTLAQMRRSLGRLAAAAVAIVIGTAFVTATLLASGVMTRTTYNAVSTGYADADLVVSDGEITDTTLAALEEVPGVSAVRGYAETGTELTGPRGQTYVQTAATAADARLEVAQLAEGALPVADGQIALPTDTARLLGVEIGDTVDASRTGWTYDEAAAVDGAAGQEAAPEPTESATGAAAEITDAVEDVLEPRVLTEHLTVVGTLETVSSMLGTGGVAAVTPSQLTAWTTFDDPSGAAANYWYALVATDAGASPGAVAASARAATGDVSVLTRDEKAAQTASQMTGDTGVFTAIVLGFAAVALLVAALVISNTFAVLVAQRTRTLALLRCVGADRAQLRRSVVTEALLLGGASSLAGLVLGIVLVQVTLVVLNGSGTDVPLPSTISLTPAALLVPLAAGTLVTVLAALSPARAATRVSPLAALRPADAPTVGERSGRVRAWFSGVLMLGGFALLAVAAIGGSSIGTLAALGIGVLGGASSFVGVVLGAVFWVPRLVGAAGRLTGHGAAGRLAAANSTRNPRRTASTSGALLIGVTLVAMMATGAASTRAALNASLDEHYPVDVALGTVGDGVSIPELPAGLTTDVRAVSGVDQVAELTGATVEVVDDPTGGSASYLDARGIDPAQAAAVLNDPEQVTGLSDTTVIVPQQMTGWTGIVDGATITLREQPGRAVEPTTSGADQ